MMFLQVYESDMFFVCRRKSPVNRNAVNLTTIGSENPDGVIYFQYAKI
jgi:hypothetical protein